MPQPASKLYSPRIWLQLTWKVIEARHRIGYSRSRLKEEEEEEQEEGIQDGSCRET